MIERMRGNRPGRATRLMLGAALAAVLLAGPLLHPGAATAAPRIVSQEQFSAQHLRLDVYSPAMRATIPVDVLRPPGGGSAPVLYLLNGASGGLDPSSWTQEGHAVEFFRDKHVNVVIPMSGAFSYYTDWQRDDPVLGRQRWETFLTRELPPLIDGAFGTTGRNAVAGLSMGGSAALVLAQRAPGRYVAAASYSGCPNTSGPLGSAYVRATVEVRGGGDTANMWGPPGAPGWLAHDAEVNAAKLRGTYVFVSAGSGAPGPHNNLDDPRHAHQIIFGGPIEAAVRQCSEQFAARMHQLGLPVDTYFPASGTHSFAYWDDALAHSWPGLNRALRGAR